MLLHRFCSRLLAASVLLLIGLPAQLPAQGKYGDFDSQGIGAQGQLTGGLGSDGFSGLGLPTVGYQQESISYEAKYELEKGSQQRGQLSVIAKPAPGYHTYSTSQPKGGPLPTKIKLKDKFVKVVGEFSPDHQPQIGKSDAWPGVSIEEFHGAVTWTAAIEMDKPIDPTKTELNVQVDGLVCSSACIPVGDKLAAKFAGYYSPGDVAPGQEVMSLRPDSSHVVWSAYVQPSTATPGSVITLHLKADTDAGYHVYPFVAGDEEHTSRTLIVASEKSDLKLGEPKTSTPLEINQLLGVQHYAGPVTWRIPISIPEDASLGDRPVTLGVAFQTCNDRSCDQPAGISFTGSVKVAANASNSLAYFKPESMDRNEIIESPSLTTWIDSDVTLQFAAESPVESDPAEEDPPAHALTLMHILAGLAGGFILNFMPCVLPVIGLKVMSFVNQAGNDHRRVIGLNLAFIAGIIAVMLVLAAVTVLAKWMWGTAFGWGEQFTVLEFKVILAVLVFAMGLSFLGVWEIPIPGFATSKTSGELMEAEGHWGAFNKGVLTTVLATPCSGPLLGSLFGLSLTLSPVSVVLLYLTVGLGMSLPYLGICVYPGVINSLPKPGPWMETLKQILAFPLLLTAVFFVASIDDGHRIATLILLVVVWFACWLIGRVPAYAEPNRVRSAWVASTAIVALGVYVSFSFFGPIKSELPWVPYNEAQLAKFRQDGKTVMIDFTANWCLNCQINTRIAIEKPNVARLVESNEVVPMLADWTEPSDEIKAKLDELQSNSIPLMAIYPPDPNAEPILLRDLLTESQVISALEEAGPSQSGIEQTRTTLTSRRLD